MLRDTMTFERRTIAGPHGQPANKKSTKERLLVEQVASRDLTGTHRCCLP